MAVLGEQQIAASPTQEKVEPALASKNVVARPPGEPVRRSSPGHDVISCMSFEDGEAGSGCTEVVVAAATDEALDIVHDRVAFAPVTVVAGGAVRICVNIPCAARIRHDVDVRRALPCREWFARRSAAQVVSSGASVE